MTAPRTNSSHDQNRIATLIGVSTADGTTPVPVEVDPTTGALQVAGLAAAGSDGAILDGVTATTKATVKAYTNANPLTVRLTDTNGDYVAASGGTQYTNAAAQATPVGTASLGWDGSNVRVLKTDASGQLVMSNPGGASAATTGTITSVASSATSVTLLALNTGRKYATFYNESTAVLYLATAATATTSAYTVQIPASGFYEFSTAYTGVISGIWASANGNVRITEFT